MCLEYNIVQCIPAKMNETPESITIKTVISQLGMKTLLSIFKID